MKDMTMQKLGKGETEGERIKVRTEKVRLGAVYVRVVPVQCNVPFTSYTVKSFFIRERLPKTEIS
jgi:hypothetical protein